MDALRKSGQLAECLSDCLDVLCRIMHSENGYVWIRSSDDDRLYVIAGKGSVDNTGVSVRCGEGIIGACFASGEPETVQNGIEDERTAGTDDGPLFSGTSLVVPMKTPLGVYGVIQLNDVSARLTDEGADLLSSCSALIALDIEDKGLEFHPSSDKTPILSLRGIVKEFLNGQEMRRVLNGIDLDVYEGELLVILGESGCGKSTLLNIIGGMDPATEGELIVEGNDFSHPSEQELTQYRRDYIGFIFQSYNLMPNLTALENIEFIAEISRHPLDSREMLDMVGLTDKANHMPGIMSGGQQQRVCIARAIVKDPRIILADEPTAALDFRTGQDVLKLIEQIVHERKTTVIMVTHNIEIAKIANRVIRLRDGMISSMRVNLHPLHAQDLSW